MFVQTVKSDKIENKPLKLNKLVEKTIKFPLNSKILAGKLFRIWKNADKVDRIKRNFFKNR